MAYLVKHTDAGSYIDGVPALKWGEYKDCTYCGAVSLLFDVMGINTSYEEIMGLTGSCYRFGMCYGWDPGSIILNTSYAYLEFKDACGVDYNANRAFGIDFYTVGDEKKRDICVRNSIDNGVPVLTLGGIYAPEWCLITGYEQTKGGISYFGRSYFDYSALPNELFTANNYALANRYPGEFPSLFVKLCDRFCESVKPEDGLKISIQTCLKMFSNKPLFGYDAYDFMINSLIKNIYPHSELPEKNYSGQNVCRHIASLLDARRAAYVYLADSSQILSGDNKKRMLKISDMYKQMFELLSSAVSYDRLYGHEYDYGFPENLRKDISFSLGKMKILEKQIRIIAADILENW